MRRSQRDERGFALITVLWAMLVLALIAASISLAAHTEVKLAAARRNQAELRARADGAINLVILHLLRSPPQERPPLDGTPFEIRVGQHKVQARVFSELGKIDLNLAPVELLEQLFIVAGRVPGPARLLAERVTEWRGQLLPGRTVEDVAAEYRNAGLTYMPTGRSFTTTEEVRLVLGMSPDIFQRIAPLVTVHAQASTVVTQYADRDVLLVLTRGDPTEMATIQDARSEQAREAQRVSAAAAGLSGQSLAGHALTISAVALGGGERRVERRAIIRITGHTRVPVWVYRWE